VLPEVPLLLVPPPHPASTDSSMMIERLTAKSLFICFPPKIHVLKNFKRLYYTHPNEAKQQLAKF
jgi:hypothetical protein